MATTAPETASARTSWLDPSSRPGSPARASRARCASRRPATAADPAASPRPTTSRGPPPRPPPPSRPGPTTSYAGAGRGPAPRRRDLRGAPRRVRRRGPSARPARSTARCTTSRTSPRARSIAAATMPFQPYGSLVPTSSNGPAVDAPARPGRRHRRDHAVELADRARACASSRPALALGNAVVLKPDPQTPVCGGAVFAAVFREAGLPDGLLHVVLGGAEVGEAIVTDPNVTGSSFTGSTAAGRRVGDARRQLLKQVSLELGGNNAFDRPRRRRPRTAAASRRRVRLVPVPGPGVLRDRPPHRPPAASRRTTSRCSPTKARATPARRPVPRGRRARADRQPEAARAGRRDRAAIGRRRRRAAADGRHARGPLLPTDRPDRRHRSIAGLARGDLRAGRAGRRRSTPTTRRSRSPTTASTGWPAPSTRARSRAGSPSPSAFAVGHGPRQRPDRQRRGDDPVRRHGRVAATAAASAARRTGTSSPSGSG